MTKFEGCYLTNEGRAMVYENGLTDITFTKAVTGSGEYESKDEILNMTALKNPKQEFGLDSFSEGEDCTVSIKFKINNTGLEEGYELSEIGIYAQNGDGTEKLYCVAYAMSGYTEEVPANDGAITYFMAIDIETVVSTTANVSIIYSEEHEWTKNYVDNALADIFNEMNIKKAFYAVFTKTGGGSSGADETALTTSEIETALSTEWNGESSVDETALTASEIETALSTKWNGETSADETALTASEIETALST